VREKSPLDYVYDYYQKFMKHLNESPEGKEYIETWEAYLICKKQDGSLCKSIGFRKNNFFINRYAQRAHHTNLDISSFFCFYEKQKDFFKRSQVDVKNFTDKYVEPP